MQSSSQIITTNKPTPVFLQAGCPSYRPTNSVKAQKGKYKLLCPRGTQTCVLAVANIAHAVYLLDVAKRPIPQR